MRTLSRAASLGLAAGLSLLTHASILTFDGVPSGTLANSVAPAGVTFSPAALLPDLDAFGDPIPGTERWRPDPDATEAVLVENPGDYGRGPAPSPANALNALWQPVLIRFARPTMDLLSFGVVLDLDTYGANGLEPAFSDVAVLFLGAAGNILSAIPVDQTQPGYTVGAGPLAGVGGIVLPAGAFYDNLALTAIPETGVWPVITGGALAAFAWWRRRRS
jgi:hypothetical protein